jgi:hypothetical protein
MGYPVPAQHHIWQWRFHFIQNASGWTETYNFALSKPGDDELASAYLAASDLAFMRRKFLTGAAAIARISAVPLSYYDAATKRNLPFIDYGKSEVPDALGGPGGGTRLAGAHDMRSALDVRVTSELGHYNRTFQFRGFPAGDPTTGGGLRFDPSDATLPLLYGDLRGALQQFMRRLTNITPDPRGVYVLRGRSKDPAVTEPYNITFIEPDTARCWTVLQLELPLDETVYPRGTLVHIGGGRDCRIPKFKGDVRVVSVGPQNAVTVARRPCCCPPFQGDVVGWTLSDVVYNYYPLYKYDNLVLDSPWAQKLRSRKTGRQREAQAGRGRRRCGVA